MRWFFGVNDVLVESSLESGLDDVDVGHNRGVFVCKEGRAGHAAGNSRERPSAVIHSGSDLVPIEVQGEVTPFESLRGLLDHGATADNNQDENFGSISRIDFTEVDVCNCYCLQPEPKML